MKEKDLSMKSVFSEGLSKTRDSMFLCRMQRFDSENGGVVAHSHEWIEVMYCFDGDMVVKLDGVDHPFIPGSLAVIPSNRIHEITGRGRGLYLSAKFPARLLSTAVDSDEFSGIIPFIFKEVVILIGGMFVSKKMSKMVMSNIFGKLTVVFFYAAILVCMLARDFLAENVWLLHLISAAVLVAAMAALVNYAVESFKHIKEYKADAKEAD